MHIEDLLRDAAADVARQATPSAPDQQAVRRRARRTRLLQLAGTAAVIATVIGVAFGIGTVAGDNAEPQPAGPSPTASTGPVRTNDGLGVPVWSSGGTIHLGERSFEASREIASPLAIVPDGVAYADAEGAIVVDRQGEQPLTVGESAPLGPASNPDTGVLAWFENDPSGTLLVVANPFGSMRHEISVPAVAAEDPESPQVPIMWVGGGPEQQTAVYFVTASEGAWRFDWGLQEAGLSKLDVVPDDYHDGLVVRHEADAAFITDSGSEVGVSGLQPMALSVDGGLLLAAATDAVDGTYVAVDTETGDSMNIDFGMGTWPEPRVLAAWTGTDTLVAVFAGLAPADEADASAWVLVECAARTGSCQELARTDEPTGFVIPQRG